MGGWSSFVRWITRNPDGDANTTEEVKAKREDEKNLSIKMLMIQSAIGFLASCMTIAEFKIINKEKPVRNKEYFRLNNRPNPCQNKAQFWAELVSRLVFFNEALIISPGYGQSDMWIAESFTREQNGVAPAIYKNIVVNGRNIPGVLPEDEVFYLKGDYQAMTPLLLEVCDQYEDIISVAATAYARQGGEHGILSIATNAAGSREQREAENKRLQKLFEKYFYSSSAVLPLPSGYSYQATASAHRNTSEINDLINLTDEWAERVALALRVPAGLLKGNVENTKQSYSDLIVYGVTPLARQFTSEYNAKRIVERNAISGDRLFIDTLSIYVQNPDVLGAFWEKAVMSGYYSVDDLRELRGDYRIGRKETEARWMTMNNGPLGAQNDSTQAALGTGDTGGDDKNQPAEQAQPGNNGPNSTKNSGINESSNPTGGEKE